MDPTRCGDNLRRLLLSMPADLIDDLEAFMDAEVIMRAGAPDGELVAAIALDVRLAKGERAALFDEQA